MTKNILLQSGQEIILVPIPDEAYDLGIAYPTSQLHPKWFITYHFRKTGVKFEDAAWKKIDTDIPYNIGLLILGTYSATENKIDFEVKEEWVEKQKSFLSLLKTHAQEGKWAVILKK